VIADIAIVGGGFTGAFAAAALADGRRRIVVLDASATARAHFGGELIHAAGVDMLASLGLWPILACAPGERIDGFCVREGASDPPVRLPYGDVPTGRPGGLAMDHQEIVARARAHLSACPGVELRAGQRVVDVIRQHGRIAGVRTAAGDEIRAAVTLIADGRHSRLRQAIGIRARQRAVSLSAILLARQASLPSPRHAHICLGAPGPILAYPMRNGDVRFCVDVPLGAGHPRERLTSLLRDQYADAVPEFLLAALAAGPPALCGNHTVYTDRCAVPGAALLGDAAGCSHPLTASGMTNSLSDISILAEELRTGDTDAALMRYEVRRYRFVRIREILADELYEAFRAGGPGAHAIRAGIFRYWRTSARGRAATVALLSGDDARLSTFVAESLRVISQSIQSVVVGQAGGGSLRTRAQSLAGLAKESLELLNRVGTGVYTGTVR
jgi:squalene monooxygenase